MNVVFPYNFDKRGRTGQADNKTHIKNLIEQVLFTAPGERVMRPNFGSGVRELVFAPGNDSLVATVQSTLQAALQQHLGDRIIVQSTEVQYNEGVLQIEVVYQPIHQQELQTVVINQRL